MHLIVVKFHVFLTFPIPLWTKYSPQHPVLEHPQPVFSGLLFTQLLKRNLSLMRSMGLHQEYRIFVYILHSSLPLPVFP